MPDWEAVVRCTHPGCDREMTVTVVNQATNELDEVERNA